MTTKPCDHSSLTHKVMLSQIYKAASAIKLISYVARGCDGHSTRQNCCCCISCMQVGVSGARWGGGGGAGRSDLRVTL